MRKSIFQIRVFLIASALLMIIFPPYYASQSYYSSKNMVETTGYRLVFGGFHFWGYQSYRHDPQEDPKEGWSPHTYNHKVAWIPFLLFEAVGLAAILGEVRRRRQKIQTVPEMPTK